MSLVAGTLIGPYEILASIGAGGMGEVYRARDSRLDRDVAIKILHASVAQHPDRLARFTREAKVLAALNHPHIATIHGLEQGAIVMELVEGPTLADRLSSGALPLTETLKIAMQIADALEAAHEKGIIHRDLKPANVKVRDDDTVKVLDFGLATAVQSGARETGDGVNSPTLTMGATEAGMILGTAAYMSPEQAAGKVVDRRADIWAFGVVLWEMLTGERLFDGETVSHTLADVLRSQIDFSKLPANTPLAIRELLERCLDRDLKMRLRDIGEARIAIHRVLGAPPTPEKPAAPRKSSSRFPWVVSAALLAALGALAYEYFRQTAPEAPVLQASLLRPEGEGRAAIFADFSVSPDGKKLAYTTQGSDGQRHLWVQPFDSPTPTLLPGGIGAGALFWAPDSRFLVFGVAPSRAAGRQLQKIDLRGGSAETIGAIKDPIRNGAWSASGDILVSTGNSTVQGNLYRIAGNHAEVNAGVAEGEGTYPQFLPDQKHYLYLRNDSGGASAQVLVRSLDAPDQPGKAVGRSDGQAAYARGFLLFLRNGTLLAQAFDIRRLETSGEATPLAEHVGSFSVGETGPLVYEAYSPIKSRLTWVDRSGKPLSSTDWVEAVYGYFALSPDRHNVAASISESATRASVWILDLNRGSRLRFSSGSGISSNVAWTPDGSAVIWCAYQSGKADLFRKPVRGNGPEELLYADSENKFVNSISPDGKLAIYGGNDPSNPRTLTDIWVLPLESGAKPRPFIQTPFVEQNAVFSPDGKWVAYNSEASGPQQVYVAPFPGPGTPQVVSITPGLWPRWRPDGKELFWRTPDGALMAAPVAIHNGGIDVGKEQKLFGGLITSRGQLWDVSADGQKILIAEEQAGQEKPLSVIMNWTGLLKK